MSAKQILQHTEFTLWHDYDVSFRDKTIYMGSSSESYDEGEAGIDYAMAERVIKNLHILDKQVQEDGIVIKMNNPGGCTIHGLAIYDTVLSCKSHVSIIGYGHVMSMGSVIFQAADIRAMTKHCRMMLHMGQIGLSAETNNFYANVKECQKLDDMVLDIYLARIKEKKPRFTKSQLKSKMANDWYLGPEEAIEYGLCDRIYGQE